MEALDRGPRLWAAGCEAEPQQLRPMAEKVRDELKDQQ
jgi:hypothetical protein